MRRRHEPRAPRQILARRSKLSRLRLEPPPQGSVCRSWKNDRQSERRRSSGWALSRVVTPGEVGPDKSVINPHPRTPAMAAGLAVTSGRARKPAPLLPRPPSAELHGRRLVDERGRVQGIGLGRIVRGMIFGTRWELGIPAVVALIAIVLWMRTPHLRRNRALRAALIVSVSPSAAEMIVAAIVIGHLFLAGGMEQFQRVPARLSHLPGRRPR